MQHCHGNMSEAFSASSSLIKEVQRARLQTGESKGAERTASTNFPWSDSFAASSSGRNHFSARHVGASLPVASLQDLMESDKFT